MEYEIRTDLALEEQERFAESNIEVQGVELEERKSADGRFEITRVKILNEAGADVMHKPIGNYITLQHAAIEEWDEKLCEELSEELGKQLQAVVKDLQKRGQLEQKELKILVAGLGNRKATPDALGPEVTTQLSPKEQICVVAPGVMAQTGMESSAYIRGIVRELQADLLIAVDSLAARDVKRLNRTIQIADTGIHPGSGVGNNRQAINVETMGIPVIAIGVPTVVDVAVIVCDVLEKLGKIPGQLSAGFRKAMSHLKQEEKRQLVGELQPESCGLYVTPKDIDEHIMQLGKMIADAICKAFDSEIEKM